MKKSLTNNLVTGNSNIAGPSARDFMLHTIIVTIRHYLIKVILMNKSHCRRYYIESIPLDSIKETPESKGTEGHEFINLLFKLEREMNGLPYEEKKEKRQVASRPF